MMKRSKLLDKSGGGNFPGIGQTYAKSLRWE